MVGDHVTVLLTNGQTARIMWNFIARIERGGVEQPMGAPAATAPAPTETPQGPLGTVTVHIEGSTDASLEQQSGAGWVTVCTAPCDRPCRSTATTASWAAGCATRARSTWRGRRATGSC